MKRLLIIAACALPLLTFAAEETIGYLGVSASELTEAVQIALDLDHGVIVNKVYKGSPADEAEIKTGDIILEIDGDKIVDHGTLRKLVKAKPNKNVKIKLQRAKKMLTKKVKLAEKKKSSLSLQMDIPDIGELKEFLGRGSTELKEELEKLKEEMKKLRDDLEELKQKIK
jgi:C-terminal processing protease CtpA/Prc